MRHYQTGASLKGRGSPDLLESRTGSHQEPTSQPAIANSWCKKTGGQGHFFLNELKEGWQSWKAYKRQLIATVDKSSETL
jgi:hypothetical protein